MYLLFFVVSFLACVVGSICGIGGGVIIKPVLDATGVMSVSSISFLSGCTVLSMSVISVSKGLRRDKSVINFKAVTPLAIGAAIGGVLGKEIFKYAYVILPSEDKVGAIQAIILVTITLGTLIYTINSSKIKTHHLKNIGACVIIGLLLGLISAFLGIGGGPINIIILAYFFSMGTKQAAISSLFVIMFSQLTSFISTMIQGDIPKFSLFVLILMVFGGVAGGMIGSKINRKISEKEVKLLFTGLMVVIIFVNIYNVIKFSI